MLTDPHHDDRNNKHSNNEHRKLQKSQPTRSNSTAITTGSDVGSKRCEETRKEGESGKTESRPTKRRCASEELENGLPVDPQPPTDTAPRKPLPLTEDPPQHVRGGPNRPNPRGSASLPAGALPPNRFDQVPQNSGQAHSVAGATTPSRRGSTEINNKPDDAPSTTPPVPDIQQEVDPKTVNKQDATPPVPEVRKKPPLEAGQGEDFRTHSNFEMAVTNTAAQDVASLTSGMFGGIANVLGMRPPATKEQRLLVENHRLKEENKNLRTDYRAADSAARKYCQETYRWSHDNQRLVEALEAMSLELKGVTKRYEEAKALSETRGKELVGAQVFLTRADALSISEVVQKVDGLNDEIYQAAASLGETIVQKKFEPSEQASCSPEEKATAEALLGSPLYRFLRSRARKPEAGIHPLLVQITLQAFFAAFCFNRIRSWTSSNFALDTTLREIYAKIWSSSDQAVSGRWRALTRAQLRPDTNEWIEELMSDLDTILAVASWELSSPEDKHTLEARLPAIFRVVLDVRESIGEKFTSADIEVAFVEPHIPFNNVYMEEAYPADSEVGHEKEAEIVITTVGMGLHKVVSLHGSRAYECALAPKVVLESSLKKAFEPQPSRTNRSKSFKR